MDYQNIIEHRQSLMFSECNILKNCLEDCTKEDFLYRMHHIIENTTDSYLKRTAHQLVDKILLLNDDAFIQLCEDVTSNTVLFPPNYNLPTQNRLSSNL